MIHRNDIDGLRAVAVIPVILFHSGFDTFSGGFFGVDVFFVISGYLITTLILEQRNNGTFSVWRFYERRARRILPALLLVMSACVLPALALMLPDDLENFGQSLVATSLFSNNILLWLTSDYFQLEAEFKPLLHTWTLGVEEQYYIIYPALLSLIWFTRNRGMGVILAVLAVASLLLAEWGWRNRPEASFYLLPTRGWELLAGALAALYLLRAEPYFGSGFSSTDTACLPSLSAHLKMKPVPRTLIVGKKNFGWNNNAVMLINPEKRYTTHAAVLSDVRHANEAMQVAVSLYPDIDFLDIMAVIADQDGKVPVFTPNRKFISQDRQHLTKAGARYLGQELLTTPEIKALVTNQYGR